ncbi:MAG TPA: hypothetical protein VGS10_18580 [Terracidiphilus sp.]|nr:hypothetical protein [Terracidiphilus sp.]
MVQTSTPESATTLLLVEAALTAIVFAVSFLFPRLGLSFFARIEHGFARLAHRPWLAIVAVGLSAPTLRLALLPLFPVPLPFVHDDFSLLLAADTFAHGRLANPTPAMWTHFETFHVTMQPTYVSMYFPGWGLLLAAGQVLFHSPWIAILLINALMCASFVWMLQAWLPLNWALLGGFIAVLRLSLFSYWINTYLGGGPLLAFAGALMLGALPRLIKTGRFRYGLLIAIGISILALSRPYEGLLLCLPVGGALAHWIWKGKNRPGPTALLIRAAVPLALIFAALAWLGYYDYRVYGSPTTLPYTIDRARYAVAPYFIWQHLRPVPHYRYAVMRQFYAVIEIKGYTAIHSFTGFFSRSFAKIVQVILFFGGFALMPPLLMTRRVLFDRRLRFLVYCVLVLMAGQAIEIFMFLHYLAPFTVVFYALGLQAMRHLRLWKPEGKPVGLTLARLCVTLCVVMGCIRVCAVPLHLEQNVWPGLETSTSWMGPGHWGTKRAAVQARLEKLPGPQLAIVRYAPDHDPLDEWVYNRADIDASKVVWAREENPAADAALLRYYKNRTAWLVEPDTTPPTVIPYPEPMPAPMQVAEKPFSHPATMAR